MYKRQVFNPLEDFLYRLPAWDGKDRIRALAATVPCKNPYWMDLFHRWFLNMVSHWKGSNKKYANSVSPLLVGPQGTRTVSYTHLDVYKRQLLCRSYIEARYNKDFSISQEQLEYLISRVDRCV